MTEECLNVVNENDEIVDTAKREDCHKSNLIHRAVAIFIFNDQGKILLQKRSKFKDLYKGYWACSVSGHLDIDESYEHAAKRELKEELGVELALKQSFFIKVRQETDSENVRLFLDKNNGLFDFKKEEIEKVGFFSINEIKEMIKRDERFTKCFLELFSVYLEEK